MTAPEADRNRTAVRCSNCNRPLFAIGSVSVRLGPVCGRRLRSRKAAAGRPVPATRSSRAAWIQLPLFDIPVHINSRARIRRPAPKSERRSGAA